MARSTCRQVRREDDDGDVACDGLLGLSLLPIARPPAQSRCRGSLSIQPVTICPMGFTHSSPAPTVASREFANSGALNPEGVTYYSPGLEQPWVTASENANPERVVAIDWSKPTFDTTPLGWLFEVRRMSFPGLFEPWALGRCPPLQGTSDALADSVTDSRDITPGSG